MRGKLLDADRVFILISILQVLAPFHHGGEELHHPHSQVYDQ